MKIEVRKKKEYIDCGDLVYSKLLNEDGFVGCINKKFYFLDKNNFGNGSKGYDSLEELISNTELELIAKNNSLSIGLKAY